MGFDSLDGDPKMAGYLLVGVAVSDQGDDGFLSFGKFSCGVLSWITL